MMCCGKIDFCRNRYFHKTNFICEENIGTNYLECRDIASFKWLYNLFVPSVSNYFFFNYHKITYASIQIFEVDEQVRKDVTKMAQLEEPLDNETISKDRSTGRE